MEGKQEKDGKEKKRRVEEVDVEVAVPPLEPPPLEESPYYRMWRRLVYYEEGELYLLSYRDPPEPQSLSTIRALFIFLPPQNAIRILWRLLDYPRAPNYIDFMARFLARECNRLGR